MEKKIVEYKAFSDSSVEGLTKKVNEAIAQGWQPLGAMSCAASPNDGGGDFMCLFSQAVVLYSNE